MYQTLASCYMQELERLSQKFEENVLDATKKFEKLITDKKEIEGLPATALGMALHIKLSPPESHTHHQHLRLCINIHKICVNIYLLYTKIK